MVGPRGGHVYSSRISDSVLGTSSIDRNGDTTLTDYGAYRIRHGKLAFANVIRAPR